MAMTTTTTSSPPFLFSFLSPKPFPPNPSLPLPQLQNRTPLSSTHRFFSAIPKAKRGVSGTHLCLASRAKAKPTPSSVEQESDDNFRKRVLQIALWVAEGVYILWLFLLPYAPGDPVWAISSDTLNSLVGLSLNFFLILPFMNFVGIRLIDAPVLHPMSEGLFNFVIGWTFMFAPLLFTDRNNDRYKGSLDVLWGLQMFLTNTFLIPYMAIRLNDADDESVTRKLSQFGSVMTNGAPIVGVIGGSACIVSLLWALFGRMDANFGGIADRWDYLVGYLGSERLAYAFIWDICLYIIFQPWLIGDNLQNVQENKVVVVKYLRYVPVIGLIAYLFCLDPKEV
ncbi:hypothetical protein AAZX31_08G254600 [Glycine max]|uniref:Transmembrane protein n=1 Tax=Glycine max TaxID=3847 RepID=I1KWU0_SOYBN|nr:uncharacterized protein LOC100809601 [Glycine max]KAG5016867.1 hypothetical protein JHK85_023003 [Glycine max]KAG5026612.1 hypothetical protein JHK86_022526 [Glycine max]KAG5137782.1 hypothetical protein JHK82_022513 [Glycine max]KAH1053140.1 hypothetical protein GYH30_022437 [Glycine max]KAH1238659.1 hypothetical protein GmHk_08G023274 [Glycine max]|eukprot:XP_003531922.1 uncharacterized protein LOC100809601 [Glycine max]